MSSSPTQHQIPPKPPDLSSKTPQTYVSLFTNQSLQPIETSQTQKIDKLVVFYQGEPAFYFTNEEIQRSSQPLQYALIGKCSYGRPSLGVIKEVIRSKWSLKGDFEVGSIDQRHVLIRFERQEDYVKTWLKDATLIEDYLFRFFKWFSGFVPGIEPSIVPLWISLPGLPLNFFNKSYLELLVKPIGRVLAYDQATLSLSKPGVARVWVEVNLLQNNPNRIWIDMGEEGARWQRIIYEIRKQFCKSCKKQGHGEEACRKRKVSPMEEDNQGKNPELETNSSAKVSKEKGKVKEIIQNSNFGKTNKETQDSVKILSQPRQVKTAQQLNGVWKQQQRPRQLNNPVREGTDVFGNGANQILQLRDVEKENQIILEKGQHSGKDNNIQNRKDIPQKERVQLEDSENPIVPNSDSVMEMNENAELRNGEGPIVLSSKNIVEAQVLQADRANAIMLTNLELYELGDGQDMQGSLGIKELPTTNADFPKTIKLIVDLNDKKDENGFSTSSENVWDDGIDESSSNVGEKFIGWRYSPVLKPITQEMVAAVHKNIHSQGEIIPSMSREEIQKALKLRGVYSKDDYVKRSSLHEHTRGFYSDGEEETLAREDDFNSCMASSKKLLSILNKIELKKKRKEEELEALALVLKNIPTMENSAIMTRSKSKLAFKIPKQKNQYGFRR